jgi:hypothetical protein
MEFVYFRVPESDKFYKIPRREEFMDAALQDLVMLRNEEHIAIGCPMTMAYLEVTTEDDLQKNGIQIVESILE